MRVVALQRFHAVRNADDGILEVPAGRMARSCLQVVLENCHSEATSVAKIACLIPTGLTCENEASVKTSAEHIRLGSEVERLLRAGKMARSCLQMVLGNCHSEATSVAKIACLIPTGLTCGNEASVKTSAEHIRLGSEVERLLRAGKMARSCLQVVLGNCHSEATSVAMLNTYRADLWE